MNSMPERQDENVEPLSQDVQDRIMKLCDKAGMPVDWLQTLNMILREYANPDKLDKILEVRKLGAGVIIQVTRNVVDKL